MTVTEFLLAHIAEDERTDMGLPHRNSCGQFGGWPSDPESFVACDCGVSARVLAECEAKRRIVATCDVAFNEGLAADGITHLTEGADVASDVLRLLTFPYSDHPEYRDEWKP